MNTNDSKDTENRVQVTDIKSAGYSPGANSLTFSAATPLSYLDHPLSQTSLPIARDTSIVRFDYSTEANNISNAENIGYIGNSSFQIRSNVDLSKVIPTRIVRVISTTTTTTVFEEFSNPINTIDAKDTIREDVSIPEENGYFTAEKSELRTVELSTVLVSGGVIFIFLSMIGATGNILTESAVIIHPLIVLIIFISSSTFLCMGLVMKKGDKTGVFK